MRNFITFRHNKFKVEPNEDGTTIVATTKLHGATIYEANGKRYLEEADGTLHELIPVENTEEGEN